MRGHFRQTKSATTNQLSGRGIQALSFEYVLLLNQMNLTTMFDNTIPKYLINLH